MNRSVLFVVAIACGGCSLGQRFVASPREYEAYRKTRADYTPEDRLEAASKYLETFPAGRFAEEVRSRFEAEESAFYAKSARSADGLEWYLHVLPSGPHAAEASLRLADLEKQRKIAEADEWVKAGRSNERRLAKAAASRRAFVELVEGAVGSIAAARAWGKPTWAQPASITQLIRALPDPGHCDDVHCIRTIVPTFQVPVAGGGLEDRATAIEFELVLRDGGVSEAIVRGPALFSRLWEAERGQPIPKDAEAARANAVGFALDLVAGAFEAVAPASRCDKAITPPVILNRRCDGWSIRVVVGDTPADDDVVDVRGPWE